MDTKLVIVGIVRSSLQDKETAPKIEHEGGVEAVLQIKAPYAEALNGLEPGREMWLFTWLHLSGRDVLEVHPRGDTSRPMRGVFTTRSPARPNPIGMHKVKVLSVERKAGGPEVRVSPLEAVDGTPVIDIKPLL